MKCSDRLASWCGACCSDEELRSGMCSGCFAKDISMSCGFCGHVGGVERFRCTESGCDKTWMLCVACAKPSEKGSVSQCESCWDSAGRLCKICGKQRARNDIGKHRCCWHCHTSWFCGTCGVWHLLLQQYLALLVEITWRRGVKLVATRLRFAVVCV